MNKDLLHLIEFVTDHMIDGSVRKFEASDNGYRVTIERDPTAKMFAVRFHMPRKIK